MALCFSIGNSGENWISPEANTPVETAITVYGLKAEDAARIATAAGRGEEIR